MTMKEVAQRISAATGRAVRYVNVAPEEAKSAQRAAGLSDFMIDALAELFAERRKGKESQVSTVVSTLLGRPATSFHGLAIRHVAVFRGEQPAPMD